MAETQTTETPTAKVDTPERLPDVVVEIEPEAGASAGEKKADAVSDLASQYREMEEKAKKTQAERDEALARAAQAEREVEDHRKEVLAARAAINTSNLDTIKTALASAQADIDRAKADIRSAKSEGDVEAEIEALERLAAAKNDVSRYDEARADLEARSKAPPRIPPRVETDPIEAYVSNRTEPTAKWLREHKDFIIDKRKNSRLTAAHYNALAEDLTPDTPEYFRHVEKFLGLDAAADEGTKKANAPQQRQQQQRAATPSRPVAPVTPSTGGSGAGANEVRLSAGEAKAATDGTLVWNYDDPTGQKRWKKGDPIGIQELARRKQKLTQDGAYDRTYETQ